MIITNISINVMFLHISLPYSTFIILLIIIIIGWRLGAYGNDNNDDNDNNNDSNNNNNNDNTNDNGIAII